jgi:S-adenosylmethionine hydrolase
MSELKTKGSAASKGTDCPQKPGYSRKITRTGGGAVSKKTFGRSFFSQAAAYFGTGVIVRRDALGQFVAVSKVYVQARFPTVKPRPGRAATTELDPFDQIWAAIPDEEMKKLPTDLAAQHDHYAYGLPKKAL